MTELLGPKDRIAEFPPVRRTHDWQGRSILDIVVEEVAIEQDTLELLAQR